LSPLAAQSDHFLGTVPFQPLVSTLPLGSSSAGSPPLHVENFHDARLRQLGAVILEQDAIRRQQQAMARAYTDQQRLLNESAYPERLLSTSLSRSLFDSGAVYSRSDQVSEIARLQLGGGSSQQDTNLGSIQRVLGLTSPNIPTLSYTHEGSRATRPFFPTSASALEEQRLLSPNRALGIIYHPDHRGEHANLPGFPSAFDHEARALRNERSAQENYLAEALRESSRQHEPTHSLFPPNIRVSEEQRFVSSNRALGVVYRRDNRGESTTLSVVTSGNDAEASRAAARNNDPRAFSQDDLLIESLRGRSLHDHSSQQQSPPARRRPN
jgi:hypothetical protein